MEELKQILIIDLMVKLIMVLKFILNSCYVRLVTVSPIGFHKNKFLISFYLHCNHFIKIVDIFFFSFCFDDQKINDTMLSNSVVGLCK